MAPGEMDDCDELAAVLGFEDSRRSRNMGGVGLGWPLSSWAPLARPLRPVPLELLVTLEQPYPLLVVLPLVLSSSQQSITDW